MVAPAPNLSVSLVTFHPEVEALAVVIARMSAALGRAVAECTLASATLVVVDNEMNAHAAAELRQMLKTHWAHPRLRYDLISGHGNVGYGQGHNKAIARSQADYHLILNPDVLIADDAIPNAIEFMESHPEVGLLAPAVLTEHGQLHHLCKGHPTVLALALRGLAPASLRRLARKRLARYELKHLNPHRVHYGVPLVSGSFMLFRRSVLEATGGFCKDYFLYFEDFDLSLRTAEFAKIAYVPAVRIEHKGGFAGRKGLKHWWMFGRSAFTFFSRYGWRWV